MHVVIRSTTREDIGALADLVRRSFADVAARFDLTVDNCPRHPSNCTSDWIAKDLEADKHYFLLEMTGRQAGCVAVAREGGGAGLIERLAVLPEARRQGCGSLLLEYALRTLRQWGLRNAEIAIIADHTELREWYTRRGFVITDTRRFPHLPFAVTFLTLGL